MGDPRIDRDTKCCDVKHVIPVEFPANDYCAARSNQAYQEVFRLFDQLILGHTITPQELEQGCAGFRAVMASLARRQRQMVAVGTALRERDQLCQLGVVEAEANAEFVDKVRKAMEENQNGRR